MSLDSVSCPRLSDIDRPLRILAAHLWGNHLALEHVLHEFEQLADRSDVTLDLGPPIMFQAESDLEPQECFCQEDMAGMVGFSIEVLQARWLRSCPTSSSRPASDRRHCSPG